ncbi:MAG TPA: hypothetical protein VGK91_08060 [Candidatus Udaeobacter sp.]
MLISLLIGREYAVQKTRNQLEGPVMWVVIGAIWPPAVFVSN